MEFFAFLFDSLFSHPIWKFISFISIFVCVILSVLFFSMGYFRLRGLDPRTSVGRLPEYPMISVVMCCKGIHPESKSNFMRNLQMDYPGCAEFLFIVESESDPAYECAKRAIEETAFQKNLVRDAKICVAGLSYHNAQKIHNMVHGIINCSPDSGFVLFVDDDVYLYPGLLEELVTPLITESDKILLSTGYEFIAPPKGAVIADYCLMTYRLHNLFSFISDRPILCWGGCWMSPIWVFSQNFAHIIDCYLDGGYSDDTIISCLAQQKGYVCAHPYRAIFPNKVAKDTPFVKYWDFLKRQFFVTDTYSTNYNKRVVHSLAYLICTSIWLLVIWIWITPMMGVLAFLAYVTSSNFVISPTAISSFITFILWFVVAKSIKFATNVMNRVSNSVRPPEQQLDVKLNGFKIFLGLNIHAFLMPIAVVYIMLSKSIVWAGVKYVKKNGKIYKVERKDENGNVISELFASSVSKVLTQPGIRAMIKGPQENNI